MCNITKTLPVKQAVIVHCGNCGYLGVIPYPEADTCISESKFKEDCQTSFGTDGWTTQRNEARCRKCSEVIDFHMGAMCQPQTHVQVVTQYVYDILKGSGKANMDRYKVVDNV